MIIVCNRIPVNPAYAKLFEERFMDRARLVDGMEGFLSFHLLRPDNPDNPYTVMTYWESKATYEAWVNSDAFKEGHARSGSLPQEAFLSHPKLEVYEVISSAG
jgi:heme-degrading monooxygenase HmoA